MDWFDEVSFLNFIERMDIRGVVGDGSEIGIELELVLSRVEVFEGWFSF